MHLDTAPLASQPSKWFILTFHQVSNDEDKTGCRGSFMTALARCTHSCARQSCRASAYWVAVTMVEPGRVSKEDTAEGL